MDCILKYIGLEKNKHYIPVILNDDDNDISNLEDITTIMNSPVDEQISKTGQQYVIENFNTCCISSQRFLNIVQSNITYYQCALITTLNLLKTGK